MEMHAAALPPVNGTYTEGDRQHARFNEYMRYRVSCGNNLIRADGFRDWLACVEREADSDRWAKHARYPEFLAWCRETKSGRASARCWAAFQQRSFIGLTAAVSKFPSLCRPGLRSPAEIGKGPPHGAVGNGGGEDATDNRHNGRQALCVW